MSIILVLSMTDCFYGKWKSYGGVGWGCTGIGSEGAAIAMTHDTTSSCPGNNESYRIQPGEFHYFDNKTWKVVVNSFSGSGSSKQAIIEIFEVGEEPDPEPEETNVKTGRINNFNISGNSPYMVGMMINWQFTVEYLETTNLECQTFFGYTKNGQTSYVGPMASKGLSYEKGTRIHPKGALKISESMLGYNDYNLKIYFCIVDNNTGITQDIKFIPIEVIETTYPDNHPIWDDPDPDPNLNDLDDPDIIPEINDNIWLYVSVILFVGLIGVMLWSSR